MSVWKFETVLGLGAMIVGDLSTLRSKTWMIRSLRRRLSLAKVRLMHSESAVYTVPVVGYPHTHLLATVHPVGVSYTPPQTGARLCMRSSPTLHTQCRGLSQNCRRVCDLHIICRGILSHHFDASPPPGHNVLLVQTVVRTWYSSLGYARPLLS